MPLKYILEHPHLKATIPNCASFDLLVDDVQAGDGAAARVLDRRMLRVVEGATVSELCTNEGFDGQKKTVEEKKMDSLSDVCHVSSDVVKSESANGHNGPIT